MAQGVKCESWVLILMVGAFVAGLLFGRLPAEGQWGAGWEMLSTIGTFAATLGAIWIAVSGNRRIDAEKMLIARLTAARILSATAIYRRALHEVWFWAQTAAMIDVGIEKWNEHSDFLMKLNPVFTEADLAAMAPLPDRAAFLLAGAIANVHSARTYLCGGYPKERDIRVKHLIGGGALMNLAISQLERAEKIMAKHSLHMTVPRQEG